MKNQDIFIVALVVTMMVAGGLAEWHYRKLTRPSRPDAKCVVKVICHGALVDKGAGVVECRPVMR